MRIPVMTLVPILICIGQSFGEFSTDSLGATVSFSDFNAQIGIGFNYDLLREPTDVSFEYPKAFFGFNLPLKKSVNLKDYTYLHHGIDSIFADTTLIKNGEEFRPRGSARQNPNVTVRVEVPMMGGVASFSNTQNFFFKYQNILGNPDIYMNPQNLEDEMSFFLRGTISVPLEMSLYWETMTFGYAYRVNKLFTFALNLHRHTFALDARGKIDVDLMGRYKIKLKQENNEIEVPGDIEYSSKKIYGNAYGHFEKEVWSPTLAVKVWRFALTSRFGINTRVKGELYAKYSVPFFIDPETFEMKYDFEKSETFNDPEVKRGLSTQAVDSVSYSSGDAKLIWKMPTGLTLSFDALPERLRISYSKLFGNVRMKLDKIAKEQMPTENGSVRDSTYDSIVINMGINVDHIIMLQCTMFNSFVNLGICAFDVEYDDQKHLIGKNMPYMKMGKSAMLPILNFGTALGTKLQLHLEADVLPLPALKTGVVYNF